MHTANLLVRARRAAGMTQGELARSAHTSRPTLSAYERGHKSPTLETAARLLAEAGFELTISSRVEFAEHLTARGRPITVPTALPRLSLEQAFATVMLPLHLNWSAPGRQFHLLDRSQRARVYEIVLREGGSADVLAYVDGVLLVDLWDELVLPRDVRAAWTPVVESARAAAA